MEKLVYVTTWALWLSKNNLASLYVTDLFAGTFFSAYGLNDLTFMVFFLVIFLTQNHEKHA